MRYKAKLEYYWTANIAYCVGLMASDGCLQSDGRHLDLTSVDIEQLQNFSIAIGRDLPISLKSNCNPKLAYRVQFSDAAFYDFLLSAGLTPRKSHTLNHISVPDEYYFDFLRGEFDGDGCVRGFQDTRWPSSLMFYVEFASASMDFIQFLRSSNTRLAGVSDGSIHAGKGAYTLSYAKTNSRLLYQAMYSKAGVIALSRKRDKLRNFINQDKAAIIARNARVVKLVNTHA